MAVTEELKSYPKTVAALEQFEWLQYPYSRLAFEMIESFESKEQQGKGRSLIIVESPKEQEKPFTFRLKVSVKVSFGKGLAMKLFRRVPFATGDMAPFSADIRLCTGS